MVFLSYLYGSISIDISIDFGVELVIGNGLVFVIDNIYKCYVILRMFLVDVDVLF